ncbi:MAG: hypothetical protein QOC63_3313 [Mycobacterium sp.]|jgi:hypothetical protein|nr:hypothetical protein [Mycobacterium sp.]
MTAYDDLAQRYIDAWNETDASARRAAVDQLYTEDANTSTRWRLRTAARRSPR